MPPATMAPTAAAGRRGERAAGWRARDLVERGEVALVEHGATQGAATGENVDPGHRVPVLATALEQQAQQRVEVAHPVAVDLEQAGLDAA